MPSSSNTIVFGMMSSLLVTKIQEKRQCDVYIKQYNQIVQIYVDLLSLKILILNTFFL